MRKDYLSTRDEPVFRQPSTGDRDPSEAKVEHRPDEADDLDRLRDSVFCEPTFPGAAEGERTGEWLTERRRECTLGGTVAVTVLAGLLSGPFAVLGAFLTSLRGYGGLVYTLVFAPIAEEWLKQSGMIFLLERKPYRIVSAVQFVAAAVLAALVFATFENLLYINVYVRDPRVMTPELYRHFRWVVCTAVHVACSLICAFGLIRVWRRQVRDGKPADLGAAFPMFVIGMAIHGLYNLSVFLVERGLR